MNNNNNAPFLTALLTAAGLLTSGPATPPNAAQPPLAGDNTDGDGEYAPARDQAAMQDDDEATLAQEEAQQHEEGSITTINAKQGTSLPRFSIVPLYPS
jgi:hypothetical protein